MDNDIQEILFDQASIHDAAVRLAKQITQDYAGEKPVVLSVL